MISSALFSLTSQYFRSRCVLITCLLNAMLGVSIERRVVGQDQDRNIAALIQMIPKCDSDSLTRATSMVASIPADAPDRFIANHAYALMALQSGKFQEAWKSIDSRTGSDDHHVEKLRLWLALETDSVLAEPIFKNLVRWTLDPAHPPTDRADAANFLGSIVGMLDESPSPCIDTKIVEKGATALGVTHHAPIKKEFEDGRVLTRQWAQELKKRRQELSQMGLEKFLEITKALEQSIGSVQAKRAELKEDSKSIGTEKNVAMKRQTELKRNRAQIDSEFRTPTAGRPPEPRRPTIPRKPRTYTKTVRKYNPRTGKDETKEVEDESKNERERSSYESSLRRYRSDLEDYEKYVKVYPDLLAQWKAKDKARREEIRSRLDQVDQEIDVEKNGLNELNSDSRALMTQSKDLAQQIKNIEQSLKICQNVIAESKLGPPKSMSKPSQFDILDFEAEANHLASLLRNRN